MSSRRFRSALAAVALMGGSLTVGAPAFAQSAHHTAAYAPITVAEVEAAQQAWGQALVAIATEYDTNGHAAATRLAEQVLDSAYAYNMGPVLFKPTLTVAPQTFRTTRDGALAYFVGGNPAYPDTGFALKGWRNFRINNASIVITGNTAISMGNVHIFDAQGNETVVDKTWGYVRDGEGKLRIVLHHSSLPYSG
ncbi:hypothetical protein [Altererythrobacter lauratis]|uniref:Phosphoribosyl-AMP cyclohydrolase n=1 Tax=Alteraurantiacibacter lauratis TaxID=2054627 RepID=A0ABV7EDC2_9SPHN